MTSCATDGVARYSRFFSTLSRRAVPLPSTSEMTTGSVTTVLAAATGLHVTQASG